MDLERILYDPDPEIKKLGDQIGLYIISQKNLAPPFDKGHFRCGAAGINEVASASMREGGGRSNLRSRSAMYFNSWVTSGLVHAFVTVPRSRFADYSELVLPTRVEGDNREDNRLAGKTRLRLREREYHARLDAHRRNDRVRSTRSEWFEGDLSAVTAMLRAIGTGVYYRLQDNKILEQTVLTRNKDLKTTRVKHRRSPRLDLTRLSRESQDLIRSSPNLLGQIAGAAAEPGVQLIQLSRARATRSQTKKRKQL